MTRKPTEIVQLKLRFAEALRRKLEKEAVRNGRSMNSEIIHRLEQSFTAPDMQALAERLHQAVAERFLRGVPQKAEALPAASVAALAIELVESRRLERQQQGVAEAEARRKLEQPELDLEATA